MTAVASRPTTRPARTTGTTARTLPPVVGADLVVPTLRGPLPYAPLDHAASTPALVAVKDAVDVALRTYSSVHRGNGYASRVTSEWYEQAREEVGRFVGARDDDTVVVTRNTTDALNLLAHCVPAGTTVVVFETEHHAALLPWEDRRGVTVSRLAVPRTVDGALDALDQALAAVTTPYALVVVAGASNVTGEVWPLERVVDTARAHGARVALDARPARTAPARRPRRDRGRLGRPLRPQALRAVRRRRPRRPHGLARRGDAVPARRRRDRSRHPARHDLGAGRGPARGRQPQRRRRDRPRRGLRDPRPAPGRRRGPRAGPARPPARRPRRRAGRRHVDDLRRRPVRRPGRRRRLHGRPARLGARLRGAVRRARDRGARRPFCAHVLVDDLLTDPWGDVPGTAVRASVGLATTAEHVDRLVAAVAELAADGPQRRWARGEQGWVADGDDRVTTLPRPW